MSNMRVVQITQPNGSFDLVERALMMSGKARFRVMLITGQ